MFAETPHIMRSNKKKWTRNIIKWYPRDGKRRRGRQITRWEDDLPKGCRTAARDRLEWNRPSSSSRGLCQNDNLTQKYVLKIDIDIFLQILLIIL